MVTRTLTQPRAASCPFASLGLSVAAARVFTASARSAPVYRDQGFFGLARALQTEPLATVGEMARLGDLVEVGLPLSPVRIYFVNSPELVEEMLVKQHRIFTKNMRGYTLMRELLGNGLVTSENELWAKQRRLMNPAFNKASIGRFAETIVAKTEFWSEHLSAGGTFDLHGEMLQLTLGIIGETLLSTDMETGSREFSSALNEILGQMIWRALSVAPLPMSVPTPANLQFRRAKRTLDKIIAGIIDQRTDGQSRGDLLDMLLSAKDPDSGEVMTRQQLADEIMTIFFAGHETTASALTWLFATLGDHPEAEAQIYQELQSVLGDRAPSGADVQRLPFLGAVIKETLRLNPPVWMVPRVAAEATSLDGVAIAKGSYVFCSPYFLQRREAEWKNATTFQPERWLAADFKPARGSYIPFLSGARKCIGEGFATMEITLIVATLLQRFHFVRMTQGAPALEPEVTLKPRGGLPIRAITR